MFLPENFNVIDNLIVIYGPDGSGKSTQAELVKKFLEEKGYYIVHITTPSNGIWGRVQRGILQSDGSKLKASIFGFLDFLSLMPHFEYARKTDFEIKQIEEDEFTNGQIYETEKKMERAKANSQLIYLMERHPLFDAVGYLPGIQKTKVYETMEKLLPKPGLAIRVRAPAEQEKKRIKEREGKLESTETLEELINADKNFDDIEIPRVKTVEVYTGDEVLPEESADQIMEVISRYRKHKYGKFMQAVRNGGRKLYKILCDAKDILDREE